MSRYHRAGAAGARLRVTVVALLLAAAAAVQSAPGEGPADVRVLIDVSGSMKKNDPSNLRRASLRLLVRLLPAGTRAGVWTFGRYVNMDIAPATVDAAWREGAEHGAANIHSRGLFTNIEDALARATWDWKRPVAGADRHVILLTDGMVDVSEDHSENEASRQRIVTEIIPRLTAAGVHVHTVALSDRADHVLMRLMASETDATYAATDDAERLQRIFLHILERTTPVDTVPIEGNEFTVDASVEEMTLLVFGDGAQRSLVTPSGESIAADSTLEAVNWRRDDGYDLVTVRAPEPGRWRIVGDADPDNRVVVVTDLKLRWERPGNVLAPDRSLDLRAWLSDGDTRLEGEGLASLSEARLMHWPSGGAPRTELLAAPGPDDGGEFLTSVAAPHGEGDHQLVLTVDGGTFVRQLRHTFTVLAPAGVEVTALGPTGQPAYRAVIAPEPGLLEPAGLEVRAWLVYPTGTRVDLEPGAPSADGAHTLDIGPLAAPGAHALHIAVSGRSPTGRAIATNLVPVELAGAPPAATPTAEAKPPPARDTPAKPAETAPTDDQTAAKSPGWPVIASAILAINVFAGVLVFVGLRWARGGSRKKTVKDGSAASAKADAETDADAGAEAEAETEAEAEAEAEALLEEPTASPATSAGDEVADADAEQRDPGADRMPELSADELELWESDDEDSLEMVAETADEELLEFNAEGGDSDPGWTDAEAEVDAETALDDLSEDDQPPVDGAAAEDPGEGEADPGFAPVDGEEPVEPERPAA